MAQSKNKERDRERRLQKRYGIGIDDYERLLKVGNGRCWVCGKKPTNRRLHVDHDHSLKGRESVRGLLCWNCNSLLQRAKDNAAILRSAAEYIEDKTAQEVLRSAAK